MGEIRLHSNDGRMYIAKRIGETCVNPSHEYNVMPSFQSLFKMTQRRVTRTHVFIVTRVNNDISKR